MTRGSVAERAKVDRQQGRLSGDIYRRKHDAQTQGGQPKTDIGECKENKQDRIAQGIQNGQLTAGEVSRLEGKESALNQETREALVNKQQDKLSKQIYNQKHDAQTQPQ